MKILKDEWYAVIKGLYILAVWWLFGMVLSQCFLRNYEFCWSWTLRDEWYVVM